MESCHTEGSLCGSTLRPCSLLPGLRRSHTMPLTPTTAQAARKKGVRFRLLDTAWNDRVEHAFCLRISLRIQPRGSLCFDVLLLQPPCWWQWQNTLQVTTHPMRIKRELWAPPRVTRGFPGGSESVQLSQHHFLKIVADLQCCVSFWCTAKWFRYTHTHIHILFHSLFHYGLLKAFEHSSLCYTVGPCLSLLSFNSL